MSTTDMPKLVEETLGLIRWHANRQCSPEIRDEVIQESCALVLASKSYDPSRPPGPWLYWYVKQARAAILRDWYRHRVPDVATTDHGVTEPDQEHAADLALLREKARGLPEAQRRVIQRSLAGQDLHEIAAAAGVSRQSVHQSMRNARRRLKLAA